MRKLGTASQLLTTREHPTIRKDGPSLSPSRTPQTTQATPLPTFLTRRGATRQSDATTEQHSKQQDEGGKRDSKGHGRAIHRKSHGTHRRAMSTLTPMCDDDQDGEDDDEYGDLMCDLSLEVVDMLQQVLRNDDDANEVDVVQGTSQGRPPMQGQAQPQVRFHAPTTFATSPGFLVRIPSPTHVHLVAPSRHGFPDQDQVDETDRDIWNEFSQDDPGTSFLDPVVPAAAWPTSPPAVAPAAAAPAALPASPWMSVGNDGYSSMQRPAQSVQILQLPQPEQQTMKQLLAGQERHIPSGTGRYHTPSHEHYTKKLSVRLGAYLNARLRKDLAEKHRIADEIIEELNTEGFTMIAKNGTELTTLKQKRAKIFVKFRGMVRSRQNQERRSPFHRQNCG